MFLPVFVNLFAASFTAGGGNSCVGGRSANQCASTGCRVTYRGDQAHKYRPHFGLFLTEAESSRADGARQEVRPSEGTFHN